jgi:hypothetical protein
MLFLMTNFKALSYIEIKVISSLRFNCSFLVFSWLDAK